MHKQLHGEPAQHSPVVLLHSHLCHPATFLHPDTSLYCTARQGWMEHNARSQGPVPQWAARVAPAKLPSTSGVPLSSCPQCQGCSLPSAVQLQGCSPSIHPALSIPRDTVKFWGSTWTAGGTETLNMTRHDNLK